MRNKCNDYLYKVLVEGDHKDMIHNGCNPYRLNPTGVGIIPNSDGDYKDVNGDEIVTTAAKKVCAIELTAK